MLNFYLRWSVVESQRIKMYNKPETEKPEIRYL